MIAQKVRCAKLNVTLFHIPWKNAQVGEVNGLSRHWIKDWKQIQKSITNERRWKLSAMALASGFTSISCVKSYQSKVEQNQDEWGTQNSSEFAHINVNFVVTKMTWIRLPGNPLLDWWANDDRLSFACFMPWRGLPAHFISLHLQKHFEPKYNLCATLDKTWNVLFCTQLQSKP